MSVPKWVQRSDLLHLLLPELDKKQGSMSGFDRWIDSRTRRHCHPLKGEMAFFLSYRTEVFVMDEDLSHGIDRMDLEGLLASVGRLDHLKEIELSSVFCTLSYIFFTNIRRRFCLTEWHNCRFTFIIEL